MRSAASDSCREFYNLFKLSEINIKYIKITKIKHERTGINKIFEK